MPVALLRTDGEGAWLGGTAEIDDDAQITVGLFGRAQLLHETLPLRQCTRVVDDSAGNVDDDAIGIVEGEHAVLDRLAQIEHQPSAIGPRPETNFFDRHGLARTGSEGGREQAQA
jgi:hypothetical protein